MKPKTSPLGGPLQEKEVLATWKFISAAMLRAARENGQIAWIRGKWGSRHYYSEDVESYIARIKYPAHAQSPSLKPQGRWIANESGNQTSSISGLSPELVDQAALLSAQAILHWTKPPKATAGKGRRSIRK